MKGRGLLVGRQGPLEEVELREPKELSDEHTELEVASF